MRGCPGTPPSPADPITAPTHDLEGADGHQAVAAVAVGPGVPARVVPLLQHKLLPGEGLALEAQPPAGRGGHGHPCTGTAPQHEVGTPGPGAAPASASPTYGPDSTWMEPTFSSSFSATFGSSSVSSHLLPWKFSSS